MYYIINKFEVVNGVVKSTPIGYTTNLSEVNALNSKQYGLKDYKAWIELNAPSIGEGPISPSEYIISHGSFNGSDAMADFIPEHLADLGVNIWQ